MRDYMRALKDMWVDTLLPVLRSQLDLGLWRLKWRSMLKQPWRHSRQTPSEGQSTRWLYWLVGWLWTLAGLLLGALLAPSLIDWAGISKSSYQDELATGIAVIFGVAVQLLGWVLLAPAAFLVAVIVMIPITAFFIVAEAIFSSRRDDFRQWETTTGSLTGKAVFSVPLIVVGYAVYRYLTWIGSGQRTVTIAFVAGLFIKTVLTPFVKWLVARVGFKTFMDWLRDDKPKNVQHVIHVGTEVETPSRDA